MEISEKPDCCMAQKQSGSEEVKRVFRAEMLRSVGGFCSWLSRLHSPVQAQSINKSPESRTHWAVIGAGKPPVPLKPREPPLTAFGRLTALGDVIEADAIPDCLHKRL